MVCLAKRSGPLEAQVGHPWYIGYPVMLFRPRRWLLEMLFAKERVYSWHVLIMRIYSDLSTEPLVIRC